MTHKKELADPPGGIIVGILVLLEILTFTVAIGAFYYKKMHAPELFAESQRVLNPLIGTLNTMVLLTAGFFMASSVKSLRKGKTRTSTHWLYGAIIFGLLFLAIKSFEYAEKIHAGHTLGHNTFFTFYWLLTGFHFIHVLVGIVILTVLSFGIRKGSYHAGNYDDLEAGGVFWHMCDLIWLLLFPVLYLIH